MTRQQRLVFLAIAVVIAVLAVVLLAGGDDEEPASTAAQPTATAEATGTTEPEQAEPTETGTPEPKPPLLTADDPQTIRVEQGERVEFRVRHDVADEVHVHGYDVYKDLEPGKVATISFKADLTGIWEVELHDAVKPLGRLRVEPK